MKNINKNNGKHILGIFAVLLWFLCIQVFQYSIVKPAVDSTQNKDKISLYVPSTAQQGNIKDNNPKNSNLTHTLDLFGIHHTTAPSKSEPSVTTSDYIKGLNGLIFAKIQRFLRLRVIRI